MLTTLADYAKLTNEALYRRAALGSLSDIPCDGDATGLGRRIALRMDGTKEGTSTSKVILSDWDSAYAIWLCRSVVAGADIQIGMLDFFLPLSGLFTATVVAGVTG